MRKLIAAALVSSLAAPLLAAPSAIFLHPDGMGAGTWAALRLREVGPDGRLAWDRLPQAAVYVGPMLDRVTASSNGGATSHAWGLRAEADSFGMVGGRRPAHSASGATEPLVMEAKHAGKKIGLVNSASVTEPGTGAIVASVAERRDEQAIAAQLLEAAPDVLLGGGEGWFLPKGVQGRHGPGLRTDGRNLIAEAKAAGYTIVYTAAELEAARESDGRLLGLFAHEETFNEGTPRQLARAGGLVKRGAPDWDVMVAAALARLTKAPSGYLLVANHEATDNLGGDNASAVLDAAAAADRAIGAALALAAADPELTVVVASDSDCGAMVATDEAVDLDRVPYRGERGTRLDGDALGKPFLAAADAQGRRLPFTIAWGSSGDVAGGLVARATGPGAALIAGTIDSTDIFRALHAGLFGR